jgi:hypothetical protein
MSAAERPRRTVAELRLTQFKRRVKMLIVKATQRNWITREQAQFVIREIGLLHE